MKDYNNLLDNVDWNMKKPLSYVKIRGLEGSNFMSDEVQDFLNTPMDFKDEDKIVILKQGSSTPREFGEEEIIYSFESEVESFSGNILLKSNIFFYPSDKVSIL